MKALYIDDTVDTCDCCGRTDLKKTVAMQLDDGGIVHYGSVCAARNSGKDQRKIKQEIIQEENWNRGRASNEWRSTQECKDRLAFRLTAPWKEMGWDAYNNHPINTAADQKRREIAAKYKLAHDNW